MGDLRIGKVTAVDAAKKTVRVQYTDENIVSNPLKVLQHGGSWMPALNNLVLCGFPYDFNSDGFVLGVIK